MAAKSIDILIPENVHEFSIFFTKASNLIDTYGINLDVPKFKAENFEGVDYIDDTLFVRSKDQLEMTYFQGLKYPFPDNDASKEAAKAYLDNFTGEIVLTLLNAITVNEHP